MTPTDPDLLQLIENKSLLESEKHLADEATKVLNSCGIDALVSFLVNRGIENHKSAFPVALVANQLYFEMLPVNQNAAKAFCAGMKDFALELFFKHWHPVTTVLSRRFIILVSDHLRLSDR